MTDSEISASLLQIAQDITIQAQGITPQPNRKVATRENQHACTISSRLRALTRMNPPIYFGSKVDEGPLDFLDQIYKTLFDMGMSTTEKAELAAYQLKDVALTWYNYWKDNQALGNDPVTWEIFQKAFLDRFLPREHIEAKVDEFINLRQGGLTQKEVKFEWLEACEKGFQELKDNLTSAPVLTLPEGNEGFVVYCDASRVG
ncbi:uncharacterized protein [Solanum lycopersicum]|uniref:uncharacterized protein n=1 Tax=Solanum lycopersicum TaxID=4081 RepID=UPI0008FED01C|nr:uncharacterized protein LOC109119545 [Solanum lycopersicum]